LIIDHKDSIHWGMILTMAAASLFMPFVTEIALQVRRIEGRYPALALIRFGLGTLLGWSSSTSSSSGRQRLSASIVLRNSSSC
jgi:hypothetical protein